MKIVLLSIDPTFGNGFGVAESIGAIPCFRQKDPKGMHKGKKAFYGYENIPSADLYVIISGQCFAENLQRIEKWRVKKIPIKVILTDTYYLKNFETLNELFERYDIEVFCMPDLYHLTNNAKLFYQPFKIDIPIVKNSQLTICHSPYSHTKTLEKGTKKILSIIDTIHLNYKFDLIVHLPWQEALKRKARSHITIDQLRTGDYIGGIGKSGLEAMLLKSICVSSGKPISSDRIIAPPVVWINEYNLRDKLSELILQPGLRIEYMEQQHWWAKKYLNYEFCKRNLL